jgi:hypothetical protein
MTHIIVSCCLYYQNSYISIIKSISLSSKAGYPFKIPQKPSKKEKTTYKKNRKWLIVMLSRQVSNLNSSDPESDVLPITPRDNFAGQI